MKLQLVEGGGMSTAEKKSSARLHPFDWTKLRKGMWIETAEIEEATLKRRTDPHFGGIAANLVEMIHRKTGLLARTDGSHSTIRIRVMTDAEAVVHTVKQAARASRILDRSAERLRDDIDRTQLSDVDLAVHDHASRVVAAMAAAQRKERERAATNLFDLVRAKELTAGEDEE